MATTFQDLLLEQRFTIQMIARILLNYRKLGKDKFTAVKTRNRIDELEKLWTECKALHVRIRQAAATQEMQRQAYFMQNEFDEATVEYESSMDWLMELLNKLTAGNSTAQQVNPDNSVVCSYSRIDCKFELP